MLLVLGAVVDLEVVGLIDVPLELVVVDLVLAVVRRDLRLRVALMLEPCAWSCVHEQSIPGVSLCAFDSPAVARAMTTANRQMEALRGTRMRIRSPREINGVATSGSRDLTVITQRPQRHPASKRHTTAARGSLAIWKGVAPTFTYFGLNSHTPFVTYPGRSFAFAFGVTRCPETCFGGVAAYTERRRVSCLVRVSKPTR